MAVLFFVSVQSQITYRSQQNRLYPMRRSKMLIITPSTSLGRISMISIPIPIKKKINPHNLFIIHHIKKTYTTSSICLSLQLVFEMYSELFHCILKNIIHLICGLLFFFIIQLFRCSWLCFPF